MSGQTDFNLKCQICGAEFQFSAYSRCEKCRRFCCRDCLKIFYYESGLSEKMDLPVKVLCYDCFHEDR